MKKENVLCMCESAAMIALAFVLSMISVFKLPFGGSITACSMLPIYIISYRRGVKWGMITSFAFSLLQFLIGMENLQFATSGRAAAAIIIFDYIFAFGLLGLAGVFRNRIGSQPLEICLGGLFVCFLRYFCHVITGCTVWAGVSIPSTDGFWYSVVYNASYMLPETIITLIAAWYISSCVNITDKSIELRIKSNNIKAVIPRAFSSLTVAVALTVDTIYLFSKIESNEGFDITGIHRIDPYFFFGTLAVALLIMALIEIIFVKKEKHKVQKK